MIKMIRITNYELRVLLLVPVVKYVLVEIESKARCDS
jgi:hypothetical protein